MIVEDITKLNKEYGLVYADPPWKQSKGGKKSVRANSSGKPLDYPVCSLGEIKERRCNLREYTLRVDGICNTITTVQKDNLILTSK